MTFGKGLLFSSLVLFALGLSSCETNGTSDSASDTSAPVQESGPINAAGFLKTDFAPLNKWLDERFEVDYKHMTPQLIFDQLPLNDIFYETSGLPSGPPLSFTSSSVSRRELLKKISQHWGLKMSFVKDDSGTPTAVKVEG
ncbi:MAG: hypothetical protein P1U85_00685 [Verrucomicrobiales bacterium]|jgi:hypothetical protein|nr:hypothetical protein [Verrucomicrobiales bacterium]